MAKKRYVKKAEQGEKRSFLDRLPTNLPFAPLVRRPDYQLRRIRLTKPKGIPVSIILLLIFSGVFFIYIGGMYDLNPDHELVNFITDTFGDPITVFPEMNSQFLLEGIAAGLLIFIGAGGFFLIHHSMKYAYDTRKSYTSIFVGLGIVTVTFIAIMLMFLEKTGLLEELVKHLQDR
ncbi:MAG: hypothetical protein EAX90_13315 [Candidatus Heimdallarchaeota archaeon]|nr:hypothetical protein [Candidatus Heimdallarchaeota archaeon]